MHCGGFVQPPPPPPTTTTTQLYLCYLCLSQTPIPNIFQYCCLLLASFLGLKTKVSIIYTPPEDYPDYDPAKSNYRAASTVTLNCTTEGESGTVSYRWSSTCKSCLARSYSRSELTEKILRTRDAGNHTCTATDSTGSRGSDGTPVMRTVGESLTL